MFLSENKTPQSKLHEAYLMATLHALFVLTGAVNTILGPLLPLLSARWSLSDAEAGLLFATQFGGSVCGVLASSIFIVRRGHRFCLGLGAGFMSAGSATLLANGYRLGLCSASLMGVGFGLVIPTTNLLVSALHPHRRAAQLSLINLSWGLGAVGCPFLVAALFRVHHVSLFLDCLAALMVLIVMSMMRISFPSFPSTDTRMASERTTVWRSRWVPIVGALFFFYVGSEGGVSGWIATFARRVSTGPSIIWMLTPSLFWIALLSGRAVVPLALRSIRQYQLAGWGLSLALAGIVTLLAARSLAMIAIGVGVAGLGFSSVFPVAIASLGEKFGTAESHVAGLMFALAGCGGASLPWLAGYISTVFGGLRYGLLVPLCGCLVMLILNLQISRPD